MPGCLVARFGTLLKYGLVFSALPLLVACSFAQTARDAQSYSTPASTPQIYYFPSQLSGVIIVANSSRDIVTEFKISSGAQSEVHKLIRPGIVAYSKSRFDIGIQIDVSYIDSTGQEISDTYMSPKDGGPLLIVINPDGDLVGYASGERRIPPESTDERMPLGSQLAEDIASGDVDSSLIDHVTVYCLPIDYPSVHGRNELVGRASVTEYRVDKIAEIETELNESRYRKPDIPGKLYQQGIAVFSFIDGRETYFQIAFSLPTVTITPPAFADELGTHSINVANGLTLLNELTSQACSQKQ
jgi:hypothetical protein